MEKRLKSWQGWLLFGGSMVVVFVLGLCVSALMERRAELASVFNNRKTVIEGIEARNEVFKSDFPREYQTWTETAKTDFQSEFNGNVAVDVLEQRPEMVVLWAGYAFSKDYSTPRGHMHAIEDITATLRTGAPATATDGPQPSTCWTCKSPDVPRMMEAIGVDAFYNNKWGALGDEIVNPIGCADCHEPENMNLHISRPALIEAFERQGKDITKATPQEIWTAFKKAFPALMMPVIMMGGILSGIFTPTEAGVVACVYAWVVSTFLYKKMNMKTLKRVAIASAKSTAVIMLIVAACQALAMVITVARIPQAIAAAISSVSSNPLVVMCLINLFVLIVGLFMDVTPALTILTPIFLPIVTDIGMDPIVFGVTMVYGLCIGLITPPVGNVLYIGIGISKITLLDLLKKIWPMVVLYIAVLFLMTVVPGLITFLPNLFTGA